MTTYSRTFQIAKTDLETLKVMVYRETWTQSILECLGRATNKQVNSPSAAEKCSITMRDIEWITFERWLKIDVSTSPVTPPQSDSEKACKARVSCAYEQSTPELNSWMDFGSDKEPNTINVVL